MCDGRDMHGGGLRTMWHVRGDGRQGDVHLSRRTVSRRQWLCGRPQSLRHDRLRSGFGVRPRVSLSSPGRMRSDLRLQQLRQLHVGQQRRTVERLAGVLRGSTRSIPCDRDVQQALSARGRVLALFAALLLAHAGVFQHVVYWLCPSHPARRAHNHQAARPFNTQFRFASCGLSEWAHPLVPSYPLTPLPVVSCSSSLP